MSTIIINSPTIVPVSLNTNDSLTITPSGSIDTSVASQPNIVVNNNATSVIITNNGQILNSTINQGVYIVLNAIVTSLTNTNNIMVKGNGIECYSSTINTLNNSGSIYSSNNGIFCDNGSTINILNNFGTITSTSNNIRII